MPIKKTADIHVTTELATPVKVNLIPYELITEIITMLFCVGGCVILFSRVLSFELTIQSVFSLIAFPILLTLVFRSARLQFVFILALFLFLIGSVFHYLNSLAVTDINAVVLLNARFLTAINERYDARILFYDPVFTEGMLRDSINILINSLSIILSTLYGLVVVKRRNPLLLGMAILVFAFCGIYLPLKLPLDALLAVLVGFVGYYIMWSMSSNKIAQFANNGRAVLAAYTIGLPITLAVVLLVNAIIPSLTGGDSAYRFLDIVISVVNGEGIDDFFGISDDAQGGMSGGQIGFVDTISFRKQVHLKIKSDAEVPMFIKGFVGERYLGEKGWTSNPEPVPNEFKWLFEDMKRRNETPDMLAKNFATGIYDSLSGSFDQITSRPGAFPFSITIENVAASGKFVYAPYNIQKLPFDDLSRTKQRRGEILNYSAFIYSVPTQGGAWFSPSFYDAALYYHGMLENYVPTTATSVEIDYERFAKQAYTRVPENVEDTISKFAGMAQKKYEEKLLQSSYYAPDYVNYGLLVDSVKEVLSESTTYSLSPGMTPKGEDPIEYFLTTSKEGYCAHYATAAALILRELNAPTRYAEGYVVTQADYKAAMAKNLDAVEVLDTNAHSWIEVYQVGPGWIPFEVTPGYSGGSVHQQNLENESVSPQSSAPTSSNHMVSSEMTSSMVSSSANSTSSEDTETKSEKANMWPIILTAIALAIVLPFAMIFVRWGIILVKRRHRRNLSSNQAVMELYEHCIRLLAIKGYKASEHSSPQTFARYVEEHWALVKHGELISVTTIVLKAKFSHHETSEVELEKVTELTTKLQTSVFWQVNFWKKFYWRFIKVL